MKNYMPRVMLVTGGAGFIGSHFVRYVLKNYPDVKVINLDALTYAGSMKNLTDLPNVEQHFFVKGNIKDRALIDNLLQKHRIDTIVHFAAESHVDRSILGPSEFVETNIIGTFTLLESARHYWQHAYNLDPLQCRFHHISTDEVYGTLTNDDPPFLETTPYSPNSPYSASKAGSDHLVNAYFETYKLPVTLTNCSNNYGPFQHQEKFMPTVIRSCVNGQKIPIYGNGQNRRDWLYVEDHCSGIDTVISQGKLGQKYNIGGQCELENIDIAQRICRIMNELLPKSVPYESLISYVTDRAGHDWRYAININKISSELGWTPHTNFEEGLSKTIAWYLNADTTLLKRETMVESE